MFDDFQTKAKMGIRKKGKFEELQESTGRKKRVKHSLLGAQTNGVGSSLYSLYDRSDTAIVTNFDISEELDVTETYFDILDHLDLIETNF